MLWGNVIIAPAVTDPDKEMYTGNYFTISINEFTYLTVSCNSA